VKRNAWNGTLVAGFRARSVPVPILEPDSFSYGCWCGCPMALDLGSVKKQVGHVNEKRRAVMYADVVVVF
jgi:hypothetical protein